MAHEITITPEFQRYFVTNETDGYRMTLAASGAVEMGDGKVFAYRAEPLQPGQDGARGVFSHVCSPVDLAEFPPDAPAVNSVPAWYRLATVDLVFRSRRQAEKAWDAIMEDIRSLQASLDAMDDLQAIPPIQVGP